MPKFLIVAATKAEVQPILNMFNISVDKGEALLGNVSDNIFVLVTGVGMVNTAFSLGKYLDSSYDFVINAGICGAVEPSLKIGEVINVMQDTLSEMGAEDGPEFIKYNDLNIGGNNSFKNDSKIKCPPIDELKKVKGITVNTVHGNNDSIKKMILLFDPQVESMEGAAFFRACGNNVKNYFQIRAVSNYVEKRDKTKWNIPLAINNVNEFVIKLIEDLNQH